MVLNHSIIIKDIFNHRLIQNYSHSTHFKKQSFLFNRIMDKPNFKSLYTVAYCDDRFD